MKIGVVGSGVAGLFAGWLFSRSGHDVVVFEKSAQLGFDGASATTQSLPADIDVPLRLFNSNHWVLLSRLYDQLGVEREPVSLSQSYSSNGECYLSLDLQTVFATELASLFKSKSRNILQQARRLKNIGTHDLKTIGEDLSFENYLLANGFDSDFSDDFIYPLLSATVCTCSVAALKQYPARYILELLANITPSQQRSNALFRSKQGTREVQRRLVEAITEIRTGTEVIDISRQHDLLLTSSCQNHQLTENFDHVIIATQANHVSRLLGQPSGNENQMLSNFDYESVSVVVHRDETLMPEKTKAWSAFNFCTGRSGDDCSEPMCTIWLNRFSQQYDLQKNVFQTINPTRRPRPESIIAERRLGRPIVNQSTRAGWRLLDTIHSEDRRNTWFVGSYASPGIPLLETAVESVVKVAERIGLDVAMITAPTAASVAAGTNG